MATHRKKKPAPPPSGRYLRKFTLQNVRTFRSPVTLDFCHSDGTVAQWTVILGENGTGKTTLLQYLAGMMPTDSFEINPGDDQKKRAFGPALVGHEWQAWNVANLPALSSSNTIIQATLHVSAISKNLSESKQPANEIECPELTLSFSTNEGRIRSDIIGGWFECDEDFPESFRLFGYGAGRHIASGASPYLTSETFFQNGGSEPTSTLYHDDYPLISPEQWFLGLDHISTGEGAVAENAKRALASANRCFANTLPDIKSLAVKPHVGIKGRTSMALMCTTPFGEVPFSSLSVSHAAIVR